MFKAYTPYISFADEVEGLDFRGVRGVGLRPWRISFPVPIVGFSILRGFRFLSRYLTPSPMNFCHCHALRPDFAEGLQGRRV